METRRPVSDSFHSNPLVLTKQRDGPSPLPTSLPNLKSRNNEMPSDRVRCFTGYFTFRKSTHTSFPLSRA